MIDVSRAHHSDAHTVKPCFALSKSEIQFVLNFPGLNDVEKLVWMVMAALYAKDTDFTHQYSFHQFAKMLGKRPNSVLRAIRELEAVGVVQQQAGRSEVRISSVNSPLPSPPPQAGEGIGWRRQPVLINLLQGKVKKSFWKKSMVKVCKIFSGILKDLRIVMPA